MSRWWADPAQGKEVLRSVDGSDVVQGVGTAVLGYHAITQAALKPLTTETLVDISKVHSALDQVDLEPVAKALGEATKPVLGDAADAYGVLLAAEMHDVAKAATERLILTWTQTGMPWPHAVERAAEVHGVPTNRLGRYANLMKGPVAPLVRQDLADRALMEYASEIGHREDTNADIAKNAQFESEHPRGGGGRFRGKGDSPETLERQARRERRVRRIGRMERVETIQAEAKQKVDDARAAARVQMDALSRIFIAPPAEKQDVLRSQQPQKQDVLRGQKPQQTEVVEAPKQKPQSRPKLRALDEPEAKPADDYKPFVHRQKGASFFITYRWELGDPEFDPHNRGLAAYSEQNLHKILAEYAKNTNPNDLVVIRAYDVPVTGDEDDSRGGMGVARDTKYDLRSGTEWELNIPISTGFYDAEVPFKVVDVSEIVSKDLAGGDLAEFNEEHPRDDNGRFRDSGQDPARESRRSRRLRRLQRLDQIQSAATSSVNEQKVVSLAEARRQMEALEQVVASPKRDVLRSGRLMRRDIARQDLERVDVKPVAPKPKAKLKPKAKDAGQGAGASPHEKRALRVNQWLDQKVIMLNEDEFAMLFDAPLGDFLAKMEPKVGYLFTEEGDPESLDWMRRQIQAASTTMGEAVRQATYDKRALTRFSSIGRAMFTTWDAAYQHGQDQLDALPALRNAQVDIEPVQTAEGVLYTPVAYDYGKIDRRVIFEFADEEARQALLNGEAVVFEPIAENDLGDVLAHDGIDSYKDLGDSSGLRPNVAGFIIRLKTEKD